MSRYLSLVTAMSLYDSFVADPGRIRGVEKQYFELLMAKGPWTQLDRSDVRMAFDAILFGTLDHLGLPRFNLPVEYVAACIARFVQPVNIMTMCYWSEHHGVGADEMSVASDNAAMERMTAKELFAFVSLLYANIEGVYGRYDCAVENAINQKIHEEMAKLTLTNLEEANGGEEEAKEKKK